jgi:hypothetical protein
MAYHQGDRGVGDVATPRRSVSKGHTAHFPGAPAPGCTPSGPPGSPLPPCEALMPRTIEVVPHRTEWLADFEREALEKS